MCVNRWYVSVQVFVRDNYDYGCGQRMCPL